MTIVYAVWGNRFQCRANTFAVLTSYIQCWLIKISQRFAEYFFATKLVYSTHSQLVQGMPHMAQSI